MYLIGVFIKTRQLFLNKNYSVSSCVCVYVRGRMIEGAVSASIVVKHDTKVIIMGCTAVLSL